MRYRLTDPRQLWSQAQSARNTAIRSASTKGYSTAAQDSVPERPERALPRSLRVGGGLMYGDNAIQYRIYLHSGQPSAIACVAVCNAVPILSHIFLHAKRKRRFLALCDFGVNCTKTLRPCGKPILDPVLVKALSGCRFERSAERGVLHSWCNQSA